jgi:hypothetical protein
VRSVSTSSIDPPTTAGLDPAAAPWAARRRRKQARRETTELLVAAFVAHALLLVLVLQFAIGALAGLPLAREISIVFGVALIVLSVTAILIPLRSLPAVARMLQALGAAISNVLFTVLIGAVFVLSLPFARLRNRSKTAARHPGIAPWVERSSSPSWRRGTWQAKQLDHLAQAAASRSTLLRVLRIFSYQQNYFLVAVAFLLVLVGLLFLFLQTSALAPFLYTLF